MGRKRKRKEGKDLKEKDRGRSEADGLSAEAGHGRTWGDKRWGTRRTTNWPPLVCSYYLGKTGSHAI